MQIAVENAHQPGAKAGSRRWYRGDCHVHSIHSDGELTPEQLVTAARNAGLDFIATTEHNTAAAHRAWDLAAGEGLLVITGEEVTTESGHWLALGIRPGQVVDWRYGVEDQLIQRCLDEVHRVGGIGVVCHPHAPYPTGTFRYPYDGFDVVEVWNGLWTSDRPWNADNEAGLADWSRDLGRDIEEGFWRPAMGNSDTHLEGQLGLPHTVVLADALNPEALLAGIQAGRSWVAGSAEVELEFSATSGADRAEIGERLAAGSGPVTVHFQVRGMAGGAVRFHTDRGEALRETFSGPGHTTTWGMNSDGARFVRCEVRHRDGSMAALTNPIVLDRPRQPSSVRP